MKTKLTKLAALLIAVIMIAGTIACATEKNPGIGRVGKVEYRIADYVKYFQTYSMMANYVEDYNEYIKDYMISRGAMLTKAQELGITLTEDEEKALEEKAQSQIDEEIDKMTIDAGIEGEEAIAKAKAEAYNKQLSKAGYYKNVDELKKAIIKELREDEMISKLRQRIYDSVEIQPEAVNTYCELNASKDKEKYENDANTFASAYNNYITGKGAVPLFTPADMFTVKHCLIQFTNQDKIGDTVDGETVTGEFDDDKQKRIDDIVAALNGGITLEEFIANYVESKDYNDDAIFVPTDDDGTIETNPQLGYREHGYIMNEKMLDKYFDGFGAAACLLHYGENWVIPVEETEESEGSGDAEATPAPTDEPETTGEPEATPEPPIEKYQITFFNTTDGHKIAKVQSNVKGGGVHFIWVAEELTAGEVTVDITNTESPEYKSIESNLLSEAQSKRFSEELDKWKSEVSVSLNNKYIDNYCRNYLGYTPQKSGN
jgi:hypothetical protein